jgi:ribosome-binding ATPase YchF (GTP1/OBG family)
LDDLRKADALIHVVDVSGTTNEKGELFVNGEHDPVKDVKFLEEEIELWMLGILERNWAKISRTPTAGKTHLIGLLAKNLSGLGIGEKHVDQTLLKASLLEKKLIDWTEEDKKLFVRIVRKISKPIVIAANKVDLSKSIENIERIKKEFPNVPVFPCSAEAELSLKKAAKANLVEYLPGESGFKIKEGLGEEQKKALDYLRENVFKKISGTGVQEALDKTVFEVLKYIAVFPAGVNNLKDKDGRVLADCFLMPPNSTALDFAFKLHTDFGKNFIKAADAKTKKLVGKDYQLNNRDAIEIVYNKS